MAMPPRDPDTLTPTFTLDAPRVGAPMGMPAAPGMPDRYVDLGFLGRGAMGEVRKARDTKLGATVAMKILHPEAGAVRAVRARFDAEARLTARLRHPNIVSVHDTGVLEDGRVWFTMQLVEGLPLDQLIERIHQARGPHTWRATPDGWTLRDVLRGMVHVAEAVGYAHSEGVVHRDLKPANLLFGAHGEVKVMDWGVALGRDFDLADESASVEALPSAHRTALGGVVGTPAYMPPEQAHGERALGPQADVYALGATLYHLLSGLPPYDGTPEAILRRVRSGPPPPPDRVIGDGAPIPPGLNDVVVEAMAVDPADRPADASILAARLRVWLRADARRAEALELVRHARERSDHLTRLVREAEALENTAALTLTTVGPRAPLSARKPGWQLEDMARGRRRDVARTRAEIEETLWSALGVSPDLPEARALLADLQRDALVQAEARGDDLEAAERAVWLRQLDDGRHARFLDGEGALTLHTDPPGIPVVLCRYEERDRRLVPVEDRTLGETPLVEVALPRGRWLLRLAAPGRRPVVVPVLVDRLQHLCFQRPGAPAPTPLRLPSAGELDDDRVLVPGGWARVGGPGGLSSLPRARVWVPGFAMARGPVTLADWLDFLEDLHRRGEVDAARRHARVKPLGRVSVRVGDRGVDRDLPEDCLRSRIGDLDREDVAAYLAWRRERDGLAWRLPTQEEWEKAARGMDGRPFPWGFRWEPTMAWCADSQPEPRPVPVGHFPGDRSVYGVLDLLGGGQEFTSSRWGAAPAGDGELAPEPTPGVPTEDLVLKGAHGAERPPAAHLASRVRLPAQRRLPGVGLRLVHDWPDEGGP
jgi:eukaryotic-like serine/threonine-protein kinase